MTVKELVDAGTFCDTVEVIVRENGNGHWIQGYRIGKDVCIYPAEARAEYREQFYEIGKRKPSLKDGEVVDVLCSVNLKMKVIKKSVEHLPDNVAKLQVCHYQPRNIPSYHKNQLFDNSFMLDIWAYPEGWLPEQKNEPAAVHKKEIKNTNQNELLQGQTNIFDYLYEGRCENDE